MFELRQNLFSRKKFMFLSITRLHDYTLVKYTCTGELSTFTNTGVVIDDDYTRITGILTVL